MRQSRSWKDKLPSILVTLAIQGAIAALLLFSITAVRQAISPVETVFLLPKPKPEPIVIDARQPPEKDAETQTSAGVTPAPSSQLPPYALPAQTLASRRQFETSALLRNLIQSFNACRKKEGEDRPVCPGVIAPADPRIVKLEDKAVKGAEIWQNEADLKKLTALPRLMVALTGDSAVSLSDPKAIGTALDAPSLPGMTGAERLQLRRYYSPQTSRTGTDWENRVRWDSAKALGYD
jgi:hypothetical protein